MRIERKAVRAVCSLLAAVMLVGGGALLPEKGVPAAASEKVTQDDIDQLRSKLNSLSSQADEYTNTLNALKTSQSNKVALLGEYEKLIATYNSYITTAQALIEGYNEQIAEKTDEITEMQEAYAQKYAYFLERLRAIREEGEVSGLEMMFSAGGFMEMLVSLDRSGDLLSYDARLMRELEEDTSALERENEDLKTLRNEQQKIFSEYETKSKDLKKKIGELEKELATLKKDIEENEQALSYIEDAEEKAEKQLNAALDVYFAQQKAEEEARKQQAEKDKLSGTHTAPKDPVIADHSKEGAIWPLPSSWTMITSPFGYRHHPLTGKWKMHTGTDIYAARNTPIYAVLPGTVIMAGYNSSYGNYVVIDHGGGISTLYAHASSLMVSAGDKVAQRQIIARVGMTGSASGYHLHIEWRVYGEATNAMNHL